MQPGDTLDLSMITQYACVTLDEHRDYYAFLRSERPVAMVTVCLTTTAINRRLTILEVYHEGPLLEGDGLTHLIIQHTPLEAMPILACHPTRGIARRALKRLADTKALP